MRMPLRFVALILISAGCSSSNSDSSSPFAGTWSCTANQQGFTPAVTTITSGANGEISISTAVPDGGTGCVATATVSGGTATLTPNQVCGTLTITGGSLTLSGNEIRYSETVVEGSSTATISGTCARQ